ncbi:tRNA (adenosine(37)-N6)-threonylcarbamoyltransferase complex dimerization subunit type 1 TsaB [Candidatus Saccharibacteria bacterium]|nr:tRNA (adenosine(37)-N6)-threonylcarbamoyltransferase complex dimerization subunit type 1 TsaB [Candidatus Saccharibacteria bacterium]MCL1963332.1 tRNA (adenosine(37)-N6)-threonylcarbamoyltransferase complex dimerization subunit type 1 TsaB [Candidatus Saccharibacteria bacterium]
MILALKTAGDLVEMYLLDASGAVLDQKIWHAERRLAHDLLGEIEKIIGDFKKLSGIIVFSGPGSFTGLRIGITTANAIAYSEQIPIIGASGEDWILSGLKKLLDGQDDKIVLPEYGGQPTITKPKNVVK